MGKKGNYCTINQQCTHWYSGAGDSLCLECGPMTIAVSQGNHYHRGLVSDSELLEDIADDPKLTSILGCLSHIEHDRRNLFQDYTFSKVSMNTLAKEYGMTRQQVYRAIRSVRHDIKAMMGLSTVF
jgi:hypothetical protein